MKNMGLIDFFTSFLMITSSFLIAFKLRPKLNLSRSLTFSLLMWHTIFCVFYWYYAQTNTADSNYYYDNSIMNTHYDFSPGVQFVESFTKIFSDFLQFSQFNIFLLYNIFGFVGLLLLSHVLLVQFPARNRFLSFLTKLIVFLPGLSFWTSAIGKDSLAFLSVTLFIFSILHVNKRKCLLFCAVSIMFLVRPHIFLMMIASLVLTLLMSSSINWKWRFIGLSAALPALFYATFFALKFVGLDNSGTTLDASSYIQDRQASNLDGDSSVDIASMSLSMRLISYLFRPFFFDASGPLWLVVSLENLVLLVYVVFSVYPLFKVFWKKPSFPVILNSIYALLTLFLLANTTANLGIAIRQKTMFLPSLLVVGAISINQLPRKKKQKFKRQLMY
jgi:hypothetical protein